MRPRAVVVMLVAAAGAASAQPAGSGSGSGKRIIDLPTDIAAPEVHAGASPSELKLGARFTLFVTAVYGEGVTVNLREPVELGGAFEVTRRDGEDHPRSDGKHVREWQLEVYAWELGDLMVPPVAVTFTSGGRAGQVETNSVPVRVTGELGDADDAKGMRGDAVPVALESRAWFWMWVAGGTCIGIACALAYAWQRQRRRRVGVLVGCLVAPAPRRIDMTSERALEKLRAIETSGVLDRDGDRKAGYAEMAQVIRDYLGARFALATLDLTSAELMRALAGRAPERDRDLVEAWLERCDVVKYGGFRATAVDAQAVLIDACELVMATSRSTQREAA